MDRKSKILHQLQIVFSSLDKERLQGQFSEYFYNHYREYFECNSRAVGLYEEAKHIYDVTDTNRKNVLEIGCGFGTLAILLSLLGAQVTAIDISPEKVRISKELARKFDLPMDSLRIECNSGEELPYGNNYYDVIVAREVVSHIASLESFLSESYRVLKSGGCIYIKDMNNSLSPVSWHHRQKVWKITEKGPSESLYVTVPYQQLRQKMIEERYPSLDENKVEWLAKQTFGLWGEEVYSAAARLLKGEKLPKRRHRFCRSPLTGQYQERPFNPFQLKKLLKAKGFETTIIPPFYFPTRKGLIGALYRLVAKLIRTLHPFSLLATPMFEVIAVKKKESN